ncbi:MAG: macro domain-containing protein [Calditrichaceae bacterium]|nr:macro domain-containing protein [Calditrichaceae bacterium]
MSAPEYTRSFNSNTLILVQEDITEMAVDAIVNAANKNLILGGGVAGAIKRKGGPSIQIECDRIGGTVVGGAVITGAGMLKAKYVIHAVGPVMGEGDEDRKLRSAVINSLRRAEENKLTSIAFPAISTGIFGYPLDRCANIMISEIAEHFKKQTSLKKVYICLWDESAFNVFIKELTSLPG